MPYAAILDRLLIAATSGYTVQPVPAMDKRVVLLVWRGRRLVGVVAEAWYGDAYGAALELISAANR